VARAGPAEEAGADEDADEPACVVVDAVVALAAAGDGDGAVVGAPPAPMLQAARSGAAAINISLRLAVDLIVALNMTISFH
jgi:hypothetical protein